MKFVHVYIQTSIALSVYLKSLSDKQAAVEELLAGIETLNEARERYGYMAVIKDFFEADTIQPFLQPKGLLFLGDTMYGFNVVFALDDDNDHFTKAYSVTQMLERPSEPLVCTELDLSRYAARPYPVEEKERKKSQEEDSFEEGSLSEALSEDEQSLRILQLIDQILSEKEFWHTQGEGIGNTQKTPSSIKKYREICEISPDSFLNITTLEDMQRLAAKKLGDYHERNLYRSEFLIKFHLAIRDLNIEGLQTLLDLIPKKPMLGLRESLFGNKPNPETTRSLLDTTQQILGKTEFWHTQGKGVRGTKTPASINQYREVLNNKSLSSDEKWAQMQHIAETKLKTYAKKDIISERSQFLIDLHKAIQKSDEVGLRSILRDINPPTMNPNITY